MSTACSEEPIDVSDYCARAVELHTVLDDPSFDIGTDQIGSSEAAKDFSRIWLRFDEELRANSPDPEHLSALEIISAHERSVLEDASTPYDDAAYLESLELVLGFHTDHCLAGNNESGS
jgi:hypothetical protein